MSAFCQSCRATVTVKKVRGVKCPLCHYWNCLRKIPKQKNKSAGKRFR